MRGIATTLCLAVVLVVSAMNLSAQQNSEVSAPANTQAGPAALVPRLVRFSGTIKDAEGNPLTGVITATFSLYSQQNGGSALWLETQNVTADSNGHYLALLGSAQPQGLPVELFTSVEARWLGVRPQGMAEQARLLLVSAPYALKAVDAETLGGLPPSAFVLAAPPNLSNTYAQSPADSNSSTSSALPASSITGSGATDFVPLWTSSSNLGNSALFQSGSDSTAKVGINTTTPAATLDVKGGGTIRGTLQLPNTGTATAGTGFNSQPLNLQASSFNSSTGKAVSQSFQWQAEPSGNDTANPSGTLNLLFGSGSNKPGETGLKLSSKGLFTFVSGQTFPGTSTITGVTAGTDLTGGGKSGNITLNLDTTKVPLLNAANAFVGNQIITGNLSDTGNINATGSITGQTGSFTANSSTSSVGVTQNGSGVGLLSQSNNGVAVVGLSLATTGNTFGVEGATNANGTGVIGQGGTGISGLGVNLGVLGTSSASNGTGVFGSGGTGVWGESSNGGFAGVFVTNGGTSGALTIGAEGIAGNASTVAFGVYGGSVKGSLEFSKHALSGAGVLGDTGQPGGYAAVVGTSDDTNAGIFYNNSPNGWTTLYAQSDESSNSGNHVIEAFGSAFGGRCYIDVSGNLVCTGSKSAVVPVDGGARKVALYAVESPENWFEDFGSGKLTEGVGTITLESTFSQTVNTGIDYHVFLTPNGDCKGLYVTRKTASSFEVLELEGGQSDVDFDYRIVARRKGYENIRLADKTKQLEPPMITGRKPVEHKWPVLPVVPSVPRPTELPLRVPIAQSFPNGSGRPSK
jgi:hypothetical protein